jgi:hypothetical protein
MVISVKDRSGIRKLVFRIGADSLFFMQRIKTRPKEKKETYRFFFWYESIFKIGLKLVKNKVCDCRKAGRRKKIKKRALVAKFY